MIEGTATGLTDGIFLEGMLVLRLLFQRNCCLGTRASQTALCAYLLLPVRFFLLKLVPNLIRSTAYWAGGYQDNEIFLHPLFISGALLRNQ